MIATIGGVDVLLIPNAIPAAISISQAREMVGQPFHDYKFASVLESCGGPVHIIACHKGATEMQAINLLGFPDATVVNAPFGIYVADNIQKVQFVFIVNCKDETTTRYGIQRLYDWLMQNGEDIYLARRASSRARIIRTINNEQAV